LFSQLQSSICLGPLLRYKQILPHKPSPIHSQPPRHYLLDKEQRVKRKFKMDPTSARASWGVTGPWACWGGGEGRPAPLGEARGVRAPRGWASPRDETPGPADRAPSRDAVEAGRRTYSSRGARCGAPIRSPPAAERDGRCFERRAAPPNPAPDPPLPPESAAPQARGSTLSTGSAPSSQDAGECGVQTAQT
jgi:hypothetical protein